MDENFNAVSLGKDVFDHIHEIGTDENGVFVPVCHFDFNQLDRCGENSDMVPIEAVTSGFNQLLGWMLSSRDLVFVGARAAALLTLLDPVNSDYRNLNEIAIATGVSRASLSKSLLELKDRYGLGLSFRGSRVRQNCSEAQKKTIAAGTHSSFSRKQNGTINGTRKIMDQSAKNRYRTLDAATDRIAALEEQLNLRPQIPAKPAALTPQQMTIAELKAEMERANRSGDQALFKNLVSEYQKRRG